LSHHKRGIGGRRSRAVTGLLALLALALAPGAAQGAEVDRDEYVERAEPICKTNTEANRRIFKGAKAEVRAGELKKASTHFSRAAAAFEKTIEQLAALPRPASDEAKLRKWIGYLEAEQRYIARIGKALAQGDRGKAQMLSVRLNRNSNLANNTVLAFGFDYCRIDSSRFS